MKIPDPRIILLSFLQLLIIPVASAQNAPVIDRELNNGDELMVPVKLDGKPLFKVRGMSSFTAIQRSEAISKRIKQAASDRSISVDSIKYIPEGDHLSVFAGSVFIMNVYEADAQAEQVEKNMLAKLFTQVTAHAIEQYRHDRSRPVLIRKSIFALGSLVLLAVVLLIIGWMFRKVNTWLHDRMKSSLDEIENKSFNLIQKNQLWKFYYMVIKLIRIVLIVALVTFTINYILGLFPWTNNIAIFTLKIIIDPVISIGQGILNFLPNLAFLVIIYLATRYLLKLGRLLFNGLQKGAMSIKGFDPDWAMPTFRILRIMIIAFALVLAYPYIPGSSSSAFKGISVFLGVLLSLGSSSFISNLIAGYSITYRNAYKPGDLIKVENNIGFVDEQKLLVTRLHSIKFEEIVIPNSVILNNTIINYSAQARKSGLIIHTVVGIGYETPWRQVEAMLKEAAERTEGLLRDPVPFVLQLTLGDFAVSYEINAYCRDVSNLPRVYSGLHQNILDVFNENNVQIMTPAYISDPEIPKVVPETLWNPPLLRKDAKT